MDTRLSAAWMAGSSISLNKSRKCQCPETTGLTRYCRASPALPPIRPLAQLTPKAASELVPQLLYAFRRAGVKE